LLSLARALGRDAKDSSPRACGASLGMTTDEGD
jgi:hypothetical protein